ncbi:MAG: SdpI family protein [Lachnospiraceae bacterium]|nr:SdpI family protein [Lachnospiraceae bacterium]MDY4971189.1 SdpI family protein [Lachnospiraceae bacterium]
MAGFWFFMLMCNLLIPACMIGFGWYFRKKAPGQINMLFGYRTPRSAKNRDTWKFAHHYFGRLWYRLGMVLLPVTVAAMLPLLGKSIDTIGIYGSILSGIQIVIMLLPIWFTESALKRTFDEDGNRRS